VQAHHHPDNGTVECWEIAGAELNGFVVRGSSSLRSIQSIKERRDQAVAAVKQPCRPLMAFDATINSGYGR
jgi:hypothetical protein